MSNNTFQETRWSQVVLASSNDPATSGAALETLCERYWRPIYAILRSRGKSAHEAEDLTQEFFFRLLQSNSLGRAHSSLGRFRSFLLGALDHFLIDQMRKDNAQKRGGGRILGGLNFAEAEECLLNEPDSTLTPEEVYDRQWAAALLQRAFDGLKQEFHKAGQDDKFSAFKPFLASDAADGTSYDAVAARLLISRGAVSKAVQRMRNRYRQLVRMEVADTVSQASDLEVELAELFR